MVGLSQRGERERKGGNGRKLQKKSRGGRRVQEEGMKVEETKRGGKKVITREGLLGIYLQARMD